MRRLMGRALGPIVGFGFVAVTLAGCAAPKGEMKERRAHPAGVEESLVRTGRPRVPDLSDDLPQGTLREAVDNSLAYYARLDPNQPVDFGRDRYTVREMQTLLRQFLELLREPLDGKAMKEAVLESVPLGTEELNTNAFERGYAYGLEKLEAGGGKQK